MMNEQENVSPSYDDLLSELAALKARDRAFFKAASDLRKMRNGDESIDFADVVENLREEYRNASI